MFSNKKNAATKGQTGKKPVKTVVNNPETIKKLICMGPTTYGNYRIIAVQEDGKEVHYYMTAKGAMYTPPRHTVETLINETEARREWDWAKKNWEKNNIPFALYSKTSPELRNNAFKALAQVRAARLAHAGVKTINANITPARLGDVPGMQNAEAKVKLAAASEPLAPKPKAKPAEKIVEDNTKTTPAQVVQMEYAPDHPIAKFRKRLQRFAGIKKVAST
jgi:hypothetical protein